MREKKFLSVSTSNYVTTLWAGPTLVMIRSSSNLAQAQHFCPLIYIFLLGFYMTHKKMSCFKSSGSLKQKVLFTGSCGGVLF